MQTKGMLDRVKETRNDNAGAMADLGADKSSAIDAVRREIAVAYIAAGISGHMAEHDADMVAGILGKLHGAMESVHYASDGLAAALDVVNVRLKARNADTLF